MSQLARLERLLRSYPATFAAVGQTADTTDGRINLVDGSVGVTFQNWSTASFGGDYWSFNGGGQAIVLPHEALNGIYGATSCTFAARIRTRNVLQASEYWGRGRGTVGSSVPSFGLGQNLGRARFRMRLNSADRIVSSRACLDVGRWYTLFGTYGRSGPRLYVNGVLQDVSAGSGATSTINLAGEQQPTIGAADQSAGGFLPHLGLIAWVYASRFEVDPSLIADLEIRRTVVGWRAPTASRTATLAATLAPLGLSATATAPARATCAATLAPLTSSATATAPVVATLSAALAPLASSATATAPAASTLSATLASLGLTATATAPAASTLSATLAPLGLSATATVGATASASLAATLAPLASSATATAPVVATLSATLATLASSATATASARATLSATLAPLGLSATATVGATASASLAATLAPLASSATATAPAVATLSAALAPLGLAATAGETVNPGRIGLRLSARRSSVHLSARRSSPRLSARMSA